MRAMLKQQWPLALVLLALAAGLAVVADGSWRLGCEIAAGSALLAMLLRLVLPRRRAGLLVVRNRTLDVLVLLFLGGAAMVLAWIVPAGS
jgi:hypothetical protein